MEMNLEEWLQEWHWVMSEGEMILKVPIDPEIADLAREHVRYIGINMSATEPRWEVFGDDGYVIGGDGDPNSLIEDLVAKRGNYFAIIRDDGDQEESPPVLRSRLRSLLNKIGGAA